MGNSSSHAAAAGERIVQEQEQRDSSAHAEGGPVYENPEPEADATHMDAPSIEDIKQQRDTEEAEVVRAQLNTQPPEIMLEIVKHMDREDKRSWRLVNWAACQAVYQGTTSLSAWTVWTAALSMSDTHLLALGMSDTHLPLPLLGKCSGLKRLSCRDLQALSSIHGLPAALEALDISFTGVNDLSPLEQCTCLKQLSVARSVNFDAIVQAAAVQQLSHILPLTTLQHLDLRGYRMGLRGAEALASILEQLTRLQHLNLRGNDMSAKSTQALAPAVQQLTGLQHLNMGDNDTDVEGARALASAIQQLTGLQHLDLGDNDVGAEGTKALAPAVQQLTGLQHLNMGGNWMGPEGAKALAPAIQHLTGLRHLVMKYNDLRVEGTQALAPAIQQLTELQCLDLQSCNLDVGGAAAMAPVMQLLPGLSVLLHDEDRRLVDAAVAALPSSIC